MMCPTLGTVFALPPGKEIEQNFSKTFEKALGELGVAQLVHGSCPSWMAFEGMVRFMLLLSISLRLSIETKMQQLII